jgi:hypothetical protein
LRRAAPRFHILLVACVAWSVLLFSFTTIASSATLEEGNVAYLVNNEGERFRIIDVSAYGDLKVTKPKSLLFLKSDEPNVPDTRLAVVASYFHCSDVSAAYNDFVEGLRKRNNGDTGFGGFNAMGMYTIPISPDSPLNSDMISKSVRECEDFFRTNRQASWAPLFFLTIRLEPGVHRIATVFGVKLRLQAHYDPVVTGVYFSGKSVSGWRLFYKMSLVELPSIGFDALSDLGFKIVFGR